MANEMLDSRVWSEQSYSSKRPFRTAVFHHGAIRVEEADAPVQPAWVVRMREAGFDVRTGTGDLPEEPEVDFSLPRATRIGIRRRVGMIARKLWQRRLPVDSGAHASVP